MPASSRTRLPRRPRPAKTHPAGAVRRPRPGAACLPGPAWRGRAWWRAASAATLRTRRAPPRGRPPRAARRPAPLAVLPPLPNENLAPSASGGDLCVQACSDDPLVAFHAVRNLARLGMGVVEHNWMELGFGKTSSTAAAQATPRNLLGFKDGTRNIKAEQTKLMDDYVWAGAESDQSWLRGGSYLVARKIRMFIENWDRDYLRDQENVIGRTKA